MKTSAILRCVAAGCTFIADVAEATSLPRTTVIRVAALLVNDGILTTREVGREVELKIVQRGRSSIDF